MGWTPVTKKTEKPTVTFALPPSWRVIEESRRGRLFVYAFDFDAAAMRQGFVSNMNALTQPVKTGASVDVMAQTTAAQIEVQIKAKTLSRSKLRIGPLDAARNAYAYSLQKPDGTSRPVFEQIALTYRVG